MKELHTSLLENRYGSVHAEICEHQNGIRIVDICDDQGICRTHAITWLNETISNDENFNQARRQIENGGLIGKTLVYYGFQKDAVPFSEGILRIPISLSKKFNTIQNEAVFRIYDFVAVSKEGERFSYGIVCEIDSPDFIDTKRREISVQIFDPRGREYLKKLLEYLDHIN